MENNLKKTGLTLLSILILQTALSQENFIPGYLILENDTLHGLIDYRNWEVNPNKIAFKVNSGEKASIYTPLDIKGFSVLDELYESAIVETDMSPLRIENIKDDQFYSPDPEIKKDTTFLQTVYKGEKSLYYCMNKIGKDQFYIKQDSSYTLLIYKKYLTYDTKSAFYENSAVENKKFQNQLSAYLQACPAIFSKVLNTVYTRKSLEKLFISYYECTDSKEDFHKETDKTFLKYGIIAGGSITSLAFKGLPYLEKADQKESRNVAGGLFLEIIPPRNLRKWSMCNELFYTTYNINMVYNNFVNKDQYTIYNSNIETSYLKMNNLIRFKYPVGSSFIYANAGISNGFSLKSENSLKKFRKIYSTEVTIDDKLFKETDIYEWGIIYGLGAKHKNYSCEIRYEDGSGIWDSLLIGSTTHRLFFLLGYTF